MYSEPVLTNRVFKSLTSCHQTENGAPGQPCDLVESLNRCENEGDDKSHGDENRRADGVHAHGIEGDTKNTGQMKSITRATRHVPNGEK